MILVSLFVTFSILCFVNNGQGCHYYREDGGMEGDGMGSMNGMNARRRKKRAVAYNPQDTTYLRRYFTACMDFQIPDPEYDWGSNVDFTVLDSLWHLNTLQIYCSPGVNGPSYECWQKEITNYLKSNSVKVLQAAQLCINDYAEDIGQNPPANRYRDRSSPRRKKRSFARLTNVSSTMPNLDRLPMFDKCIMSSIAYQVYRTPLQFNKLAFFVNQNTETLCDSRAVSQSLRRPSWPYRIVALTRPDTDIRQPLEECAVEVFPPDPFWSVWGGFNTCSATCGMGSRRRRRTCRDGEDPRRLSQGCIGKAMETLQCKMKSCPRTRERYSWGNWSPYTLCSSSCGGGVSHRSRPCLRNGQVISNMSFCIRFLKGRSRKFKYCNRHPCKSFK